MKSNLLSVRGVFVATSMGLMAFGVGESGLGPTPASAVPAAFVAGTCSLSDVSATNGSSVFAPTLCGNFAGNNNNFSVPPNAGFEFFLNDTGNALGAGATDWSFLGADNEAADPVTGSGGAQTGTWAVNPAIASPFVVTVKAGNFFAAYLFDSLTGIIGGDYSVAGATTKVNGGDPAGFSHLSVYVATEAVPLPAALPLMVTALAGLGFAARRRRRA